MNDKDKDKEWEDYLLSIGVINLNDEGEINRKLEEVERANPDYETQLREALTDVEKDSTLELVNKDEVVAWLLSLGN